MSTVAWRDELDMARAVAAERRRVWDEAPELTAEEIVAGLTRELRSVSAPGFGKVFYYYPMSIAEHLGVREKIGEGDDTTAAKMVDTIIALARNSDGTLKFKPEHAAVLLNAPDTSVLKIASTLIGTRVALVSAEKK